LTTRLTWAPRLIALAVLWHMTAASDANPPTGSAGLRPRSGGGICLVAALAIRRFGPWSDRD